MNDMDMADEIEAIDDLRCAWEAEQYEAEAAAYYNRYVLLDEEAYGEWLEDNDLPDTPHNRDRYEAYLDDLEEMRAGA